MSRETIVGTAYLWDANTIAEEAPLKANGEADWDKATKWHYEPETFRPIAKETANGELFYIVNDHLGTPREMFSEDGKLVWAAQYRTWGAIHKIWQADNDNDIRGPYPPPIRGNLAFKYDTVEAQAAQSCPIRFQGQWEDAETGLYYNRFRYYDPLAAQYISPDPIGLAGGLRPNGYVHNPNAWIDPWGLNCCLPKVKKGVNSGLNHAIERSIERDVFPDLATARSELTSLTNSLKSQGWPKNAFLDFSDSTRVLVPTGNNGLAVYQVLPNGTARLKTVLIHDAGRGL